MYRSSYLRAVAKSLNVGISAEFPSGTLSETNFDHKSFFEFLLKGQDAYERVPKDRFNIYGWQGSHLGQVLPEKACFLKNIHLFDHFEFGISSKNALTMGVATRKLIEHAFLALLDSGIHSRSQNVGAYTSGIAFDLLSAADADEFDVRDGFGGGAAAVSNGVSYQLDLLGPSIPVDTACSSSLMALHLGVQALRAGDCEAAVIGGSQINYRFLDWVYYSQLSILSPSGKSSPFDASADGMGRGEAVVVFVIKLLEDAIRDGDKIYATVLSTAINSTGSAGPLKTPIPESQAAAMLAAYNGIGRSPTEVDFVECHATGTSVGDPVEANGVGNHFKRDEELLIGSVKGNFGHPEIASFLAGLTKVCGMFATNRIPPQANYTAPNPAIHWDEYNMRVPIQIEEFKTRHASGKRLVSLNSSGLGGSNGHVIAETPPQKAYALPVLPKGMPVLLIAAGLSPRSATTIVSDLSNLASEIPDELPTLSNIYGRRARQLTWRTAAVSMPGRPFEFSAPRFVPRGSPPLVFVFSGQGPQHIEMGRQLFKVYAAFRESLLRMDKVHVEVTKKSIVRELGFFGDAKPETALPDTWPVTLTVPSIAMIQMALIDLFAAFGVRPNLVFGHSAGEAAMSYASGAVPQELAMEIAIRRSQAMTMVEGSGGMAAVSCIPSMAREIIQGVLQEAEPGDVLELGCYNAPEAVTISGTQAMLDKAITVAQKRGMFARQIKARVPGHCSLLGPCKARYVEEMEIAFSRYPGAHIPKIPTYSTQTGARWEKEFTPEYMWNNGRVPVKFEHTVIAVVAEMPEAIFIEIGPHPALSSYISQMGVKPEKVLCPMRRARNPKHASDSVISLNSASDFNEVTELLTCVGNLCALGVNMIDFSAVNGTSCLEVSKALPAYPFAPKAMPFYSENSRMAAKQKRTRKGPLNFESFALNALTHPDLAEHVVKGEPILPATGFFEMMFEEGARTLWDIELRSLLPLLPEKVLEVQVKTDALQGQALATAVPAERLHATGFMTTEPADNDLGSIDLASIRARCTPADITNLYAVLESTAAFGPLYRRIEACFEGEQEILFQIRGNGPELTQHYNYVFHPSVLDSCIHGLLHPIFIGNPDKNVFFLPSHIDRVILYDRAVEEGIPETLFSHVVPLDWTPESVACNAFIVNERGEHLVTLINCVVTKHWAIAVPTRPDVSYECIYQPLGLPATELVLPDFEQEDYSFLDTMTTPTEQRAIALADGRKDFETVFQSNSSDESELKPSSVLSLFSTSLSLYVATAHHIFDLAVKSGKQVLRLLDLGDATGSLHKHIVALAAEYPALRLDYAACGHENIAPDLRNTSFSIDTFSKQSGLPPNTYDVVVATHTLGFAAELERSLEFLSALLVPGGFLVALEVNGAPETVGGKWVDHVFSPHGHWPGLRSGKQYRRRSQLEWNENFARASLRVFDEARLPDNLFLNLVAQKPSLSLLSSSLESPSNSEKPVVFSFEHSHALDLQQIVLSCMSSGGSPVQLWIEATSGTYNGAVATGFARSLTREIVTIDIRLVLFDAVWKLESRVTAIQQLAAMTSLEPEIAVDVSGKILVPRLRSYSPQTPYKLDNDRYWIAQQPNTVIKSAPPFHGPHQVLVKISALSGAEGGLQGIVGTVARSSSSSWKVGVHVLAVVPSTHSNFVLVHEGQITDISDLPAGSAPDVALLLVFVALALRLELRPLESLQQIQVVVLHTGKFASSIARLLEHLVLPCMSAGDIIMCGLPADSARTIPRFSGVFVFNWSDTDHGALAAVAQNPWLVGTTIHAHLGHKLLDLTVDGSLLIPEQLLPPTFDVSQSLALADDRFYVIIGGIGSLGLHLAIWLYRKGARHIALTSRQGVARLTGPKNRAMRSAISYLQSRPDLDLRLEACDASSVEALTKLIRSLDCPLAGCVFSAAVLADRLFLKQDADSFPVPFKPKTDAYFAQEKVVDLQKLDFVLALSSVASLGSAGQTNYAAANTGIEYLMARYPNTWAFLAPGISDSNLGIDLFTSTNSRIEMWGTSTISSYEMCLCLEDGLLRMMNGERISHYVPNLNWDAICTSISESPLYNHLVKLDASQDTKEVEDPYEVLRSIVLKFIDASEDDFERNVPLASYGLDSLFAARMSTALKPYLAITQIQLLGDLSLDDLVVKMKNTKQVAVDDSVASSTAERQFAWDAFNQPGQTVLKLVIGSGTPLIIFHGGAGDIAAFRAVQEQFSTPLWAVQPTPEAPLDSVDALAQFYFEKIKEARPAGPYRIAGFSASSMVTLRLAQLFEANEDEIAQLTFIDHFPMLFTSSINGFTEAAETFAELLVYGQKASVVVVTDCCSRESAPARRTYGENLIAASQGRPSATNAVTSWEWIQKLTEMNLRQIIDSAGGWGVWSSFLGAKARQAAARAWVAEEIAKVQTPMSVLIANRGLRPVYGTEWNDLGVLLSERDILTVHFDAGHFDLFEKKEFSRSLEFDWVESTPEHELAEIKAPII
ncbi:polyketide synthase [Mycena albidolilacea]|uniref:Polyketide synthase n=1 Tax=Mycena albidolilacea TaxID=1033008 RepID=A0AAD7EUT4_9AGAR|nr:polyketide synthase [Mycena albidolilacea]